jgi:hypothetical protein
MTWSPPLDTTVTLVAPPGVALDGFCRKAHAPTVSTGTLVASGAPYATGPR